MKRIRDERHSPARRSRLTAVLIGLCLIVTALYFGVAEAENMTRSAALESIASPVVESRRDGVRRLAAIGRMADVDALQARLRDTDPLVRELAAVAMWQVWGRSGDAEIDELYLRGTGEMQDGNLVDALETFNRIVLRKPDFAEGWNKRATIRFLVGDYENSLADCDEVFKRNPNHFGALAGAGQIHLMLGHAKSALDFFSRALAVNPNLDGPAKLKPILEQLIRDEEARRRGQPV